MLVTMMMATAATALTACSVKKPDKVPASPAPSRTLEPRPGETIVPSPTQPPAEVDPPHRDPGDRVPPPAPPKAR